MDDLPDIAGFIDEVCGDAKVFCTTGPGGGVDPSCGAKPGSAKPQAGKTRTETVVGKDGKNRVNTYSQTAGGVERLRPQHEADGMTDHAYQTREAHRDARASKHYEKNETSPGKKNDTEQLYSDGKGNYTKPRQKLHQEAIADALRDVPEMDKPTLYIMGGGPAAGKSSIIKSGQVGHPARHVLANPDVFKEDLPEYNEGTARKYKAAAADAHEESSYLNKEVLSAAATGKRDTVWDGTGDNSIEKLDVQVVKFRIAGHRVKADYVTCDTNAAFARATKRGEETGRVVPEKNLRETHRRVSEIFPEAVKRGLFDEANLWDTGAGGKPVLIVSVKGKVLTIHDQAAYDKFLAKANEYPVLKAKQMNKQLDANEMNRLTRDAVQGVEPSISTAEARAFYDAVKREVDEIHQRGQSVDFLKE